MSQSFDLAVTCGERRPVTWPRSGPGMLSGPASLPASFSSAEAGAHRSSHSAQLSTVIWPTSGMI